jgi:Mrp family chromosome partitioning ATPase
MAELEDRIYSVVGSTVQDPEFKSDLKTLGWLNRGIAVSKDGTIQILLRLTTLLHPGLDELKQLAKVTAETEIKQWAADKGIDVSVKVNIEAIPSKPVSWLVKDEEDQKDLESRLGPGLASVAHVIGVYSCKGGVGKSTVAVNLAYELARLGGRIGLLDLDVYGPSLPILVNPKDPVVRQSPLGSGMVYPIEHEGVKLLSLGFVSSKVGSSGFLLFLTDPI